MKKKIKSIFKYFLPLIFQKKKNEQKRKFSTTSINDRQLSRQKIRQKFSVIKTKTNDDIKKWHFNSHFVLKTKTNKQVFVMIAENFWQIFWHDNWRSLIGVVENFC